jgi:hypothetical protein
VRGCSSLLGRAPPAASKPSPLGSGVLLGPFQISSSSHISEQLCPWATIAAVLSRPQQLCFKVDELCLCLNVFLTAALQVLCTRCSTTS